MKRIILHILVFIFLPPIIIILIEVIGIENLTFQIVVGYGLWVYLVLIRKVITFQGVGNPIKTKPNPNAVPCFAIIDVETTGLIKYDETPTKKSLKENPNNFPRIVQIAWTTLSRKYEIVQEKVYYIKQSQPIPIDVIKIHKITNEICEEKGHKLEKILREFSEDITPCDYYVGHNVMFDKRVIEAECIRSKITKPFKYMKKYDTMKMGREIMERKWFKLEELGLKFFGKKQMKEFNLHNASDDVSITAVCFAWLHKKGYKY